MRLVKQNIERKSGSGTATLLPDEPEDMWHAYNLIRPNDLVRAAAVRRVTTESMTGSTSSQRVQTTLTIRVTSLDFDPQAGQLHVSGKIAAENALVKMGQYHTLDLELHRNFTLEKADGWDSIALDMLKDAIDQDKKAELWAVIMSEGLANICLITEHQTILRQRIETSLPKKRPGKPSSDHDKGTQRFYSTTLETLLRQMDTTQPLKPLLLASPGFTATSFQAYIKATGVSKTDKTLRELSDKIIIAHSASGHMHDLAEVLASPQIRTKLSDTKFARETELMDKFFEMLRKDDGRAWYGPKEVELAVEKGAVGRGGGVLLISDSLFRAQDVAIRRRWVSLVDRVRETEGGEIRVLSSMHESGKRLEGLTGVAAILTFPMDEMDEDLDLDQDGEMDDVDGGPVQDNGVDGVEGRPERYEDIEI